MRHVLLATVVLFACSSPSSADDSPAKDAYGDPLPQGAVARFGTVRLRHPGVRINALAFAPDGKSVVSCGGGPFVVVWSTEDGTEKRRFTFEDTSVQKVLVSPDGKFIVAKSLARLTLWPAAGGKPVLNIDAGRPVGASFTSGRFPGVEFADGGKTLVVVEEKDAKTTKDRGLVLRRYETATGKELDAPKLTATHVTFLTPDGKTLYGHSPTGAVVVNLADGSELRQPVNMPSFIAAASADGQFLAGVGHFERSVDPVAWVWDEKAGKATRLPVTGYFLKPDHAGVSPDGAWVVAMGWTAPESRGGAFRVDVLQRDGFKNPVSFRPNLDRGGEAGVTAWAFAPDGKTLALSNGQAIDLLDLATGKLKDVPGSAAPVSAATSVAFAPDGKTVGTLNYHSKAQLWDAATGKLLKTVGDPATCFAFSSDGKLLATADAYGRDEQGDVRSPRVWDIETGASKLKIPKFRDPFGFIRFADDDKKLIATMGWRFTGAFDASTGKVLWNKSESVSFGPIGKSLYDGFGGVWGLQDGKMYHWNMMTNRNTRDVGLTRADAEAVYEIACNGKTLVILDAERNCFRVWDMTQKQWAVPILPAHAGHAWGRPNVEDKYDPPLGGSTFKMTDDGKFLLTAAKRARPRDKTTGPFLVEADDWNDATVRVWDLATGRELARVGMGALQLRAFAVSADGKRLLTAHHNAAPLVWDLEKFAKPAPQPVTELKPAELELRWLELIHHNPIEANKAAWPLARAGPPAAKFVAEKLTAKPPAAPADQLDAWVKDLDGTDADARHRAYLELANQIPVARDAVFKATNDKLKTNAGRDLYWQLVKLSNLKEAAGKRRDARAVEVLELMNTADALAALKKVGESDAPAAEAAKAAAARVEKRLP